MVFRLYVPMYKLLKFEKDLIAVKDYIEGEEITKVTRNFMAGESASSYYPSVVKKFTKSKNSKEMMKC